MANDNLPHQPPESFTRKLWREWIKPVGSMLLVMIVVRSSLIDWNDVPSGSMLPTIQIGDRVVVNKLAYGLQIPMGSPYIEIPLTPWRIPNPLKNVKPWKMGPGPARGEIITFWSPTKPDPNRPGHDGIRLIKRVVAIPGDTIAVHNGLVYINGHAPDYKHERDGETRVEHVVRENGQHVTRPARDGIEKAFGSPAHRIQFLDETPNLREMNAIRLLPDQFFCMGDDRDDSSDARMWMLKDGVVLHRDQITGRAFGVAWSLDGWTPRWDRFFSGLK